MITRFYKILDKFGLVIYVGVTLRPINERFKEHILSKNLNVIDYSIVEFDRIEHPELNSVEVYYTEKQKVVNLERKYIKEELQKGSHLLNISAGGEWGAQILYNLRKDSFLTRYGSFDNYENYHKNQMKLCCWLNGWLHSKGDNKTLRWLRTWKRGKTDNRVHNWLKCWCKDRSENKTKVWLKNWRVNRSRNKSKMWLKSWMHSCTQNKTKRWLFTWVRILLENKTKVWMHSWITNRTLNKSKFWLQRWCIHRSQNKSKVWLQHWVSHKKV